jgi:hypothetical protein
MLNSVYLDLVQQWMRARPIDMMCCVQSLGMGWHVWILCVGGWVCGKEGGCVWGRVDSTRQAMCDGAVVWQL